jgi:hypothetical protein
MNTLYFSATKGKKEDCLLYKHHKDLFTFVENNVHSLPSVYNTAINIALEKNMDYLVLCHDDVIINSSLALELPAAFKRFDVVGVAGTSQAHIQKPVLWHLMSEPQCLHGAVAHGTENQKFMTSFGVYPHRVVMLDGVFLAIKREVFENVRFDENNPAKFHFYDLIYTLTCHQKGYKVGVGDIMITHASPGLREFTDEFKRGEDYFINTFK